MATPTYTLIDSVTLSSSAASVTFSSIIQDYGDLIIVFDGKVIAYDGYMLVQLNSDTGSNYSYVFARSSGSSRGTSQTAMRVYDHLNTDQSTFILQIMDYSATDKHKTMLSRGGSSSFGVGMNAGRWANTSAVTSVLVIGQSGLDFAAGSTFYLYGIEA